MVLLLRALQVCALLQCTHSQFCCRGPRELGRIECACSSNIDPQTQQQERDKRKQTRREQTRKELANEMLQIHDADDEASNGTGAPPHQNGDSTDEDISEELSSDELSDDNANDSDY